MMGCPARPGARVADRNCGAKKEDTAGRPANKTMSLKRAERLATPKELAEYGPSDPMTESQILALIESEMNEDLKKAAAESAAQAKVAAMRELAAVLDQEVADKSETNATGDAPFTEIENTETQKKELSESDRVAAAFFGEEDTETMIEEEVVQIKEAQETKEVKDATKEEALALTAELANRRKEAEASEVAAPEIPVE